MLKSKRKLDYIYLLVSTVLSVAVFLLFHNLYGVAFFYGFLVMSLIIEWQVRGHLKDLSNDIKLSGSSVVGGFFIRFLIYGITLTLVTYFFGIISLCIAAFGLTTYRNIYFASLR